MIRLSTVTTPYKPVIISLAILLSACHSHRGVQPSSTETYSAQTDGKNLLSKKEASRLFSAIYEADNQWQRLRIPLSLRVMEPMGFSISGTATMVHEESVFISLRMLGFEVAQILIDNDRILAVDKYHKKYFAEPLTELVKNYDFNLSNLQSLLIGAPFVVGQDGSTVAIPEFEFTRTETIGEGEGEPLWTATAPLKGGGQYGFVFGKSGNMVGFAAEMSQKVMTVEYSQPFVMRDMRLSGNAYFTIPLNSGKHPQAAVLFEWNFGRARWDNDVEPKDIRIPEGYDRVTIGELVKLLGNK